MKSAEFTPIGRKTTQPPTLVEIWRGSFLESAHRGHVAVCDERGDLIACWGDPDHVVLPRSAIKMIQALPLIESGAAQARSLRSKHLALACASHTGAAVHTDAVRSWLASLDRGDIDLRCGPQWPEDREAQAELRRTNGNPRQHHNNCSGKHVGFLTLAQHLGGGPEYIHAGHPVQQAVREAFERCTGAATLGFAIDGCSAPNLATTMQGLARAMARFAAAKSTSAERLLVDAMIKHPDLVAGDGRACTRLIRAAKGLAVVKTGAEGVFTGIIPGAGLGIAVKIEDGATRAAEAVIAALLVRYNILSPDHPDARAFTDAPIVNRRKIQTGHIRVADTLRDAVY